MGRRGRRRGATKTGGTRVGIRGRMVDVEGGESSKSPGLYEVWDVRVARRRARGYGH